MIATWNSYIKAPKRYNIKVLLIQRCIELGLTYSIKSEDINRDFIDKILCINRELITFNIEGELNTMKQLYSDVQNLKQLNKK